MRFLSDPAAVDLGAGAWYLLVVVFLVVPWLALRSGRTLAARAARGNAEARPPTRLRIYASTAMLQAALLVASLAVAGASGITLFPRVSVGARALLIGACALALGLITLCGCAGLTACSGRASLAASRHGRQASVRASLRWQGLLPWRRKSRGRRRRLRSRDGIATSPAPPSSRSARGRRAANYPALSAARAAPHTAAMRQSLRGDR